MHWSSQAFPHLRILKSLCFTEIFKCSLFTFILFSRGPSSQVAGGGGGAGEVGPAKEDLCLQELCGKASSLQVQSLYLALHGCVCSSIAMWTSEPISSISLRPKSLTQPQPSRQGAGGLVTHGNLAVSRPKEDVSLLCGLF